MNDIKTVSTPAKRVVVSVAYLSNSRNGDGSTYSYFDTIGLVRGDYVLVAAGTEETIKLAQVKTLFDVKGEPINHKATRSVIAKVTDQLMPYFQAIDLRMERQAALSRLEQIDKRHKSVERYERLAELDPEAAELVKMLKDTQGQVLDEVIDEAQVDVLPTRLKRKSVGPLLSYVIKPNDDFEEDREY